MSIVKKIFFFRGFIYARLQEIRNKNNTLQKDIAEYLNINVSTYQRYEYGTRNPSLEILIKIATYFNVSTDYLLGLSDDPTRR